MPSPDDLLDVSDIEHLVKHMYNDDLKDTLRNEGQKVSGVKAVLQGRIIDLARTLCDSNDSRALSRLRYRVAHKGRSPPNPGATPSLTNNVHPPLPTQSPLPPTPAGPRPVHYTSDWQPSFKASAFYRPKENLAPAQTLCEAPRSKNNVIIHFTLPDEMCSRMKSDPSLRVMLYCAETSAKSSAEDALNISFPAQIEVKANNMEVRSNYKGLKNKPGTTKPADLTEFVRKKSSYPNQVAVTWALTLVRFVMVVKLVKKYSPPELAADIAKNRRIEEDTVRREMISNAEDDDIVATSTLMTLKDEVSCTRIKLPCRSTICKHNQCFDAETFLELQDQAPQWKCPICYKQLSFSTLAIDGYFENILKSTPATVEQVVIEPNGEWRVKTTEATVVADDKAKKASYDKDSDEDLVEVTKSTAMKAPPPKSATPGGVAQFTPPGSSREASVSKRPSVSSAASGTNGSANKRNNAVIDLTLSDDDEPPRPTKRQAVAPFPSRQGSTFSNASRPSPVPGALNPRPNGFPARERAPPNAPTPFGRQSATPVPRPAYADRVAGLSRETSHGSKSANGEQRFSQPPLEDPFGVFGGFDGMLNPWRNQRPGT